MGVPKKIRRASNPVGVCLEDAFNKFIIEKEALQRSAATVESYQKSYQRFLQSFEGEIDGDTFLCSELTEDTIFEWMAALKSDGIRPQSINHYLRDMRTFVNWCKKKEYITGKLNVQLTKTQEELPKDYSKEEMDLLLRKPIHKDEFVEWRMWAIVNFIYATGAREDTICNLAVGTVDLKSKRIVYTHTKNKKPQVIPISNALASVLREYIKMWRSDARASDYLFCSISGEKLSGNAIRKAYATYSYKRGVDKTSLHGIRHTFAREWILADGSPFKLQKLLGHSTLDMTKNYVKLYGNDLSEDINEFNPLDKAKKKYERTKKVR